MPRTVEELTAQIQTKNLLRDHPETDPKAWIRLARTKIDEGESFFSQNKYEEAYLAYLYAVQVTLEVVPAHKKFSAAEATYQITRSKIPGILTRLETLKEKLKSQNTPTKTTFVRRQSSVKASPAGVSAPRIEAPLGTISITELQNLLMKSDPRILILDIRPMEDYVAGHICWKTQHKVPAAGVVNIEPSLLRPGVTSVDIENYLVAFGPSVELFRNRTSMDVIVFYDKDTRTAGKQQYFQTLFDAIYVPNSPIPKALTGGFMAWKYLVTSQNDLNNNEWIEIGDSNGILSRTRTNNDNIPVNSQNTFAQLPRSNNTSAASLNLSQSSNGGGYSININYSENQSIVNQQQNNYRANINASTNYINNFQSPGNSPNMAPQKLSNIQLLQQKYQALSMPTSMNTSAASKPLDSTAKINDNSTYSASFANQSPSTPPTNYARSPVDYVTKKTAGSVTIPARQSSLDNIDRQKRTLTRKDTFNDPFLGRSSSVYQPSIQPNNKTGSGLADPLISLPNNGNSADYRPEFSDYLQAKSKYPEITYQEPTSVSYPRARSPEVIASPGEEDFTKRFPTLELIDSQNSPPPVPIKMKTPAEVKSFPPLPSIQPARPELYQPYQPPAIQPPRAIIQPLAPPSLPIKPVSRTPSDNAVIPPPIAPKPRISEGSRSPPLPPKPASKQVRADTIVRGQHPFVLPSSPIGNKFGISGLRNLGNTCFMNSTLQCLSATYPFARYFMDGSYRRHISRNNPLSSKGRVAEAYSSLIRQLWSAEESVVIPIDFKAVMGDLHHGFAGNEQQDSQEFLSFLLDQLHEDLNVAQRPFPPNGPEVDSENYDPREFFAMELKNYHARNWSIVVDMFQGTLQSRLQCLTCGKTSTTYNMFMYLTLPIPPFNKAGKKNGPVTVFECLESFLAPEKLSGDDQWKCPRCKVKRDASKTLAIVKLPTVLLIHFKRFSFNGPFRDKVETPIDFPVRSLDLSGYTLISKNENQTYSLCGVSNHYGGLNGGHYTAQIKHVHTDKWFNLDDSRASESSESETRSSAAYILFYICNQNKTSDWWTGTPAPTAY